MFSGTYIMTSATFRLEFSCRAWTQFRKSKWSLFFSFLISIVFGTTTKTKVLPIIGLTSRNSFKLLNFHTKQSGKLTNILNFKILKNQLNEFNKSLVLNMWRIWYLLYPHFVVDQRPTSWFPWLPDLTVLIVPKLRNPGHQKHGGHHHQTPVMHLSSTQTCVAP